MLELGLLLLTSIITARFLEKRYRLASVFHAILFIVMAVTYFFASEEPFLARLALNMLGEDGYRIVHNTMTDCLDLFHIGFSSILAVEVVIFASVSMISAIILIRGIKKVIRAFNGKHITPIQSPAYAVALPCGETTKPTGSLPLYLLTRRLRN